MNVFNSTAAVPFQRISQDLKAGAPQADIYSSTDASHLVTLKSQGHLQKYVPENIGKAVEAVRRLNDPEGYYLMTFAGLVLLCHEKLGISEGTMPASGYGNHPGSPRPPVP